MGYTFNITEHAICSLLCLQGPVTHQLSLEKEVMSLIPGARDLIFTVNVVCLVAKKKKVILKFLSTL